MQTKTKRRPGVTRPTGNQQSLRGKYLVDMDKRQVGAMGKLFGRPGMARTLGTKRKFGSRAQGRDQPSRISPSEIRIGSKNTASGKSEMVEQQGSGRTLGNMNLEWKIETRRRYNRK
jgi:hypothetical protein